MASNRLFIYDPVNKKAVCIAKGYTSGWASGIPYVDRWFDDNPEYINNDEGTRYELKTEDDVHVGFDNITYEDYHANKELILLKRLHKEVIKYVQENGFRADVEEVLQRIEDHGY